MVENEYRYIDEFSNFEINFGFVKGYEPSTDTRKKNINNIFANYYKNLNLKEFSSSDFHLAFEKVNNDTFLKVFDQHINDTDLKPNDQNILESNLKFNFVNEEYSLDGGFTVYEDLEKNSSDRYQYVLPYFNFNKNISENFLKGNLNFSSSGENNLTNTNRLESSLINNLDYVGNLFLTNSGFENNFGIK